MDYIYDKTVDEKLLKDALKAFKNQSKKAKLTELKSITGLPPKYIARVCEKDGEDIEKDLRTR